MKLRNFAGSTAAFMVVAGSLISAVPSMAQGYGGGYNDGPNMPKNDFNGPPPPMAPYDNNGGPGMAPPMGFDQYGGGPGPQNGTAISWRGSVDDTVDIYIQGGSVNTHVDSGNGLDNEHYRIFSPLPNRHFHVFLTNVEGRGRVWIFQQPNRDNGFTVGIRIRDPQAGRANYHFGLGWQFDGPGPGPRFGR